MAIFKKKTKQAFVCGYCGSSIDKKNEPKGQIIERDGKPVCTLCRVAKFGKMSDMIKADKIKYETDKQVLEKRSQEKALQEVKEVAYASQIKAESLVARLSPKKFLK